MAVTCSSGGGLDNHIKDENIATVLQALDAAGKDYINVKISFAEHAFSCEERPSYNKTAADDAFSLTLAFMKNS